LQLRTVEVGDIAGYPVGIEPDLASRGYERVITETASECMQQLAQPVARPPSIGLGPQQGNDLVPAQTPVACRSDERKQRERLPLGCASAQWPIRSLDCRAAEAPDSVSDIHLMTRGYCSPRQQVKQANPTESGGYREELLAFSFERRIGASRAYRL
jgi:hypothetical protein